MKKINLIFIWALLLFTINISAQQVADVFDSVFVEDMAGGEKMLKFGLDTTATDGIDPQLGESDLPPFPPSGAFEARFFLPDNNFQGTLGSYDDYRQAVLPFTGVKEFRLAYQVGTGTMIRITWNLPPDVTGVLQDIILGTLINEPMSGSGNFTVADPGAFNRLKMLITYDNTIPVELTSFTAAISGKNVELNWLTASEVNSSGFEVQRKSESTWEKIGFVESAGSSIEARSYSFTDENLSGTSYTYRLKIIDLDGTFSYSNDVEVDFSVSDYSLFQNYPNPFNPSTDIRFSIPQEGFVTIKVYDMLGQEITTLFSGSAKTGIQSVTWDGTDSFNKPVTSGSYICKMTAGGFTDSKKMILIK